MWMHSAIYKKSLTMYKKENNDQNFTLMYCWDKVKVYKEGVDMQKMEKSKKVELYKIRWQIRSSDGNHGHESKKERERRR